MGTFLNPPQTKKFRTKLRNELSVPERILWKHIKSNRLGFGFRRQYGIGNYIVDFCSPKIKLVIEVDGDGHSDEKVYQKDLVRQKYLEDSGFTVKRYSAGAVVGHTDDVLSDLYNFCERFKKDKDL